MEGVLEGVVNSEFGQHAHCDFGGDVCHLFTAARVPGQGRVGFVERVGALQHALRPEGAPRVPLEMESAVV